MASAEYLCPEWQHAALVLIDVQNDFISGSSVIDGTAERVKTMGRVASIFRAVQRPIVHIVRLYPPGSSDIDTVRRAAIESGTSIVAPDTRGAQIPPAVLPTPLELDSSALLAGHPQPAGPNEIVLYKPRWSAFYRTSLDSHLRALGVTTVVVAGCNLPNCPRATLFDACERDYRAVLITDATSQCTPERLEDLGLLGVSMLDTDEVAAAMLHAEL
jgi:nicotinamidase-related amidase